MSMALVLATARRMGEGERARARRQMDRLEPDLDAGRRACRASAWASSAWAASARRWRAARAASASPSTITTASALHGEIERELEATYWESLDQMLARMDIVSVNCPHTPATFHLLSARRLKLMKPHGHHRQHRARRGDRRERPGAHAEGGRAGRRRPRRLRARAAGQSRSCSSSTASCCCRTWARPRSRAASTWARRC